MSDKKLNILFLSSWYPNRVLPTLGNFVQKHAEAVALNSNVAALFVCSDVNCKSKFELEENIIHHVYTVNVYYKKVEHTIPLISQLQKSIRYIRAHFKGLKKINTKLGTIDIVHHNILYPAGIIALYLKVIKHIPYIITENWTGYLPSKNIRHGGMEKVLSNIIAHNANYITPVSRDLRDAMINLGFEGKYEIIYNVVNTDLFHPQLNKEKDKKIKLLHISTLDDAHKNISGMLRVIKELSKQRSDFEMWFVGDGDTEPHIKTANQLGIYRSFAFFDGSKTTEEVAEIMRSSDCFVLFSNYENLPCVMVEALASGIPVVSSTVGGIPEHITKDFGLLVAPLDEAALLRSLDQIIDDIRSAKYDPEILRNYAENNFSYQKVSEKFHELYHRILKTNV